MGFKDLALFNNALLAKQTWRLLHDTDSLFYRVFKAKIFPHSTIMEAKNPANASYAWKSILKGRDVIKRGAAWRIGSGMSVQVWGDNWLPTKHSPRIISPMFSGGEDAKVGDFIDQVKKTWKEDLIDEVFYGFEASIIKTIPLCRSIQDDVLIWPLDGNYSVKSGYRFLQEACRVQQPGQSSNQPLKPPWNKIWALDVPNKVKTLVWRACKNSLPTKVNMVCRKITSDGLCEICKQQDEDVMHALYRCPALQALWNNTPEWNQNILKQNTCFTDFTAFIFAGTADPELFTLVLWNLWNRRNNLRLGKPSLPLDKVLEHSRERQIESHSSPWHPQNHEATSQQRGLRLKTTVTKSIVMVPLLPKIIA